VSLLPSHVALKIAQETDGSPTKNQIFLITVRAGSLNDELILGQFEELAEKLGIKVRYENVNMEETSGTGGLCRIKGEYVLIIHYRATVKEKIAVMTRALKHFDLTDLYVRPVIRELLEAIDEEEP
jgi:hypothetical protein